MPGRETAEAGDFNDSAALIRAAANGIYLDCREGILIGRKTRAHQMHYIELDRRTAVAKMQSTEFSRAGAP
jgi:hypothetical protein